MKHRELLAGATTTMLLAACGPNQAPPEPDQDFAKKIPAVVSQYESAVALVTDGTSEGTAVAVGNIALTAKHVVDTCKSGVITGSAAQDGYEARGYTKKGHRDLAKLALNGKFGSGPWPEFAPQLPKANEKGYFITYQGDNASKEGRGPGRKPPFDKPATYEGIVAKSTQSEVRYVVPTTLGDINVLEGASGAPVFDQNGKVTSIVSKGGDTPLSADTINSELGSSIPPGYYEVFKTLPVTLDTFEVKDAPTKLIC